MGSVGLPEDKREEARRTAICAHTILNSQKVMVILDLWTDFRFQNSPSVRKDGLRFYAGAPLMSPEGFKLGTICLMDTRARSFGLTEDEKNSLVDLADTVMDLMEGHRNSLETGMNHSLVVQQRSASNLQGQLSKLNKDDGLRSIIEAKQKRALQPGSESCQTLYASLVPGKNAYSRSNPRKENPNMPPSFSGLPHRQVGITTTIDLNKFIKSLEYVMELFPKDVHLIFSIDSKLPETLIFNDLKVFRSAIAFLTSACERTKSGHIHFRMFERERVPDDKDVVFECEDTGPDVGLDHSAQLFMPPDNGIEDFVGEQGCIRVDRETGEVERKSYCETSFGSSDRVGSGFAVHAVAQYIGSLGGDYGFRPRTGDTNKHVGQTGSVFWFSIPLRTRPA